MVSCVWEFDLGDGCFELVLAHIRSRGTASQQGLGSAWWAPERLLSHGLFESARWVLAEWLSSGAWTPTVMGCVPSVFFPQRERQAQREDALELTEKLDQDWKEIQALLACKTPKSESGGGKEKPKVGRTRDEMSMCINLLTVDSQISDLTLVLAILNHVPVKLHSTLTLPV